MKNIKTFEQHLSTNGYETIASTAKYSLVKIYNGYRIENIKGLYKKEVPYVEIPKSLADDFISYLIDYKEDGYTKSGGIKEFNNTCDKMFDEEHTELLKNAND